jgi:y4mF family transcriptional regulator
MTSEKIARIIVFHRKKSKLTQKHLADLAGVGKTVVFDLEKGKNTVQLNSLLKIISVLNIKMEMQSPLMHLMEKLDEES